MAKDKSASATSGAKAVKTAADSKKNGKKQAKKNDAQLLIRINGEERDEFLSLCDELDTSAAREVRRFIRSFIRKHQETDV
ncbi:MAG: hypothetical protein CMI02_12575 [Oceanospirillaceae bacterium]|nr:hypothetical protein [Oceanospirillaceae bacterium]MBT12856.1 hypothetical protein [Oceanospirillaceae bacterium]|tara:strand:+ start:84344 stop:84586 length:243 start_codon:yes stop_codon:yes gene_type:complete